MVLELNKNLDSGIPFINLKAECQTLQFQIQERIDLVLEHGQHIMVSEARELEKKLQDYTHARYCITVSSGADALLLSLMALGVGPGEEIITAPITFVATV